MYVRFEVDLPCMASACREIFFPLVGLATHFPVASQHVVCLLVLKTGLLRWGRLSPWGLQAGFNLAPKPAFDV